MDRLGGGGQPGQGGPLARCSSSRSRRSRGALTQALDVPTREQLIDRAGHSKNMALEGSLRQGDERVGGKSAGTN